MPSVHPPEPAPPTERIGPYRLLRPISAGGMARVYEGRLDSLAGVSTRVAVKVIHPDFANEGGFQELFIQEARISARLEHVNVVRVQQFNREGSLYYLVMEYIDGVTFRKIISACRKHGLRLPAPLLAELGRQACEGLHYAHSLVDDSGLPLRLVHRDMKPSNLMLNVHGVVKVLDFGISYAHGTQESRGSVKGTWGYMAPEQAEGESVGGAADLFGLASVLFEVATLEPLFAETDNSAIRSALAHDEGARRAAGLGGAYTDLAGQLVRALQRDPAARFRTAEAMGRALGGLVPDPMAARDELVRFVAELRRLDHPGAVPIDGGPAGVGSSASVSSASASGASVSSLGVGAAAEGGPRGLPVVTGNAYAPAKPKKASAKKPGGPSALAPLLTLAALMVSLPILGFTAWKVFGSVSTPAPSPEATLASGGSAPGGSPAGGNPAGSGAGQMPTPAAGPTRSGANGEASPQAGASPEAGIPGALPASAPDHRSSRAAAGAAGGGAGKTGVAGSTGGAGGSGAPAPGPTRGPAPGPGGSPTPDAARALVAGLNGGESGAAVGGEGLLSVSSTPRAQVMVDGAYVRFTPLFQHSVTAGQHTVVLVTEDGRRKSFRVDVAEGRELRRIWIFDENRWADEAPAP